MKLHRRRRLGALPIILMAVLGLLASSYHCVVMGLAASPSPSGMACHASTSDSQTKSCCLPSRDDEQTPASRGSGGPCCAPNSNVVKPASNAPLAFVQIELAAVPETLDPLSAPDPRPHASHAQDRAGPPAAPERAPRSSRAPPLA